jgi:hypothetical protein
MTTCPRVFDGVRRCPNRGVHICVRADEHRGRCLCVCGDRSFGALLVGIRHPVREARNG